MKNDMNEGLGTTFVAYQLLKKLMTPFEKWDLFKEGIIDKKGVVNKKLLKEKPELKNKIGLYDKLVLGIKVILDKYINTKMLGALIIGKFLFENEIPNKDIELILNNIIGDSNELNELNENSIKEKDVEKNYSLIESELKEIMNTGK